MRSTTPTPYSLLLLRLLPPSYSCYACTPATATATSILFPTRTPMTTRSSMDPSSTATATACSPGGSFQIGRQSCSQGSRASCRSQRGEKRLMAGDDGRNNHNNKGQRLSLLVYTKYVIVCMGLFWWVTEGLR